MRRLLALVFAYLFLTLAFIGFFLPGLPTVPFLLLTAWFAARGSERLHQWIYDHPQLGQLLIDWEQSRSIARRYKVTAVIMLLGSWIFLLYKTENIWVLVGAAVLFITVGIFLITRREPK